MLCLYINIKMENSSWNHEVVEYKVLTDPCVILKLLNCVFWMSTSANRYMSLSVNMSYMLKFQTSKKPNFKYFLGILSSGFWASSKVKTKTLFINVNPVLSNKQGATTFPVVSIINYFKNLNSKIKNRNSLEIQS